MKEGSAACFGRRARPRRAEAQGRQPSAAALGLPDYPQVKLMDSRIIFSLEKSLVITGSSPGLVSPKRLVQSQTSLRTSLMGAQHENSTWGGGHTCRFLIRRELRPPSRRLDHLHAARRRPGAHFPTSRNTLQVSAHPAGQWAAPLQKTQIRSLLRLCKVGRGSVGQQPRPMARSYNRPLPSSQKVCVVHFHTASTFE